MARTTEDLVRLQLGTQALELAKLQAQLEKVMEENQRLKAAAAHSIADEASGQRRLEHNQ